MKVFALVVGIVAALTMGLIALFTIGETAAIAVFLGVLGTGVYAWAGGTRTFASRFVKVAGLAIVGGTVLVGWQMSMIVNALRGTEGPAEPADGAALVSAYVQIATAAVSGDFRLELTEDEIEAVVQDGLSDESPLSRVDVMVVDGTNDQPGTLEMTGHFKSSDLTAEIIAGIAIADGTAVIVIESISMGLFSLPESMLQAITESIDDLNEVLGTTPAVITQVHIGDGKITVLGGAA